MLELMFTPSLLSEGGFKPRLQLQSLSLDQLPHSEDYLYAKLNSERRFTEIPLPPLGALGRLNLFHPPLLVALLGSVSVNYFFNKIKKAL